MTSPGEPTAASMPDEVREHLSTFTSELDRSAPGLLVGLYVVGSVALGDFQPRFSNIDAVAVTDRDWRSEPAASALKRASRCLDRRGHPAGLATVTWDELARDPRPLGQDLANPFTWKIIGDDAMVERGPDYPAVWHDEAALKQWARARLAEHWEPWVKRARRRPTSLVARRNVATHVLEACQVFQAASGRVQSQSAAGRGVQEVLAPRHSRILRDSYGYRAGSRTSMYWGPVERRRHAIELFEDLVQRARQPS